MVGYPDVENGQTTSRAHKGRWISLIDDDTFCPDDEMVRN
jgi:hypothetical protein